MFNTLNLNKFLVFNMLTSDHFLNNSTSQMLRFKKWLELRQTAQPQGGPTRCGDSSLVLSRAAKAQHHGVPPDAIGEPAGLVVAGTVTT